MPAAFAPSATAVIAVIDDLRADFPGWQLEVDIAGDGTPSVCAYLFWQVQRAESYTLAFVPDQRGVWVAIDGQFREVDVLDASLAVSMRHMIGRLGVRQVT